MSANVKDIAEVKGNFKVDGAHSSVVFATKHIVTYTRGSINVDSGFVNLDNASGPKILIVMDMTTLNTQNKMRDEHLSNADFFDVAKFKTATFEGTSIEKNPEPGKFAYTAKGKLTMHGVTKDVDLKFNYLGISNQEWEGKKVDVAGFDGEAKINTSDFGMGKDGSDVTIEFTLEAGQDKN
jgi:polyisoprenoid-binding protein YceI